MLGDLNGTTLDDLGCFIQVQKLKQEAEIVMGFSACKPHGEPGGPTWDQVARKMLPRCPKMVPKMVQDGPKMTQDAPQS